MGRLAYGLAKPEEVLRAVLGPWRATYHSNLPEPALPVAAAHSVIPRRCIRKAISAWGVWRDSPTAGRICSRPPFGILVLSM
jgi:hypothetical protein